MYIDTPKGKIYYEVHGKGKPVLIVYGAGSEVRNYINLRKIFLGIGYKVIQFDFFGHGKSSGKTKNQHNYFYCIDSVLNKLKIKKCSFFGNSAGASILLRYTNNSKKVENLILSAPAKVKILKCLIKEFIKRVWIIFKFKTISPSKIEFISYDMDFTPTDDEELKTKNIKRMIRQRKHLKRDILLLKKINIQKEAEKINVPTLIIKGEKDNVSFTKNVSENIHKYIKNSRIRYIKGLKHQGMELKLDEIQKEVKEFFEEIGY